MPFASQTVSVKDVRFDGKACAKRVLMISGGLDHLELTFGSRAQIR